MWRLALIGLVGCGESGKPGGSTSEPGENEPECDAVELPYDGVDNDCDGSDLTDVDGDGHDALEAGGEDCDDDDAAIHPDVEEIPYDGLDQDCSGADLTDLDGDGYGIGGYGPDDCDDADPEVHPDAEDIWYDGVDQNCLGDCDYDADHDQAVPVEWHDQITDGSACDRDPSASAGAHPDCDDADPEASTQQVESTWPEDGAVDVDPETQIEVYFADNEDGVWVRLLDPSGDEVSTEGIIEVDADSLAFILFPERALDSAVTYTVESTHSCGTSATTFTTR
jgi:hypothetical protein